MLRRALRFALGLCAALPSAVSADQLDWDSVGLRQNVVLCAALFQVRGGLMIDFGGDEAEAMKELNASLLLQDLYRSRTFSFLDKPDTSEDRRRSPVIRGPLPTTPFNLEEAVLGARNRVTNLFLVTGAMKALPPACEADQTCASCGDLLRAMREQK